MESNQLLPGQELYNRVRAGFILQNTTLGAWCRNNSVIQTNAKSCLHGTWSGRKGKNLRERLVKESNIENLSLNAA